MSYTARTRDRHRLAVVAVTGVVAAGSMTSIGWLAGAAAHDQQADLAEKAAEARRDARLRADRAARTGQPVRTVVRKRPTATRTTTRYVTAPVTQTLGGGGTLGLPTVSRATSGRNGTPGDPGSGSGSSSSGPSTAGAPPPAPPPPPPSSSGS